MSTVTSQKSTIRYHTKMAYKKKLQQGMVAENEFCCSLIARVVFDVCFVESIREGGGWDWALAPSSGVQILL